MSHQTSVRPARRPRPAHRVHPTARPRPAARARGTHRTRRTRGVAIRQLRKTAERLGLITRRPRPATQRSGQRRARTSRSRVELRAQARNVVHLVSTPGPAYFATALLAGMAAAFLAGLWLY